MTLSQEPGPNDSSPALPPPVAPAFEEALRDLQVIVSELEGGSISLDQSLKRFEQGIGLLRVCYQFLDRADQRIEQLVSLDANGNCTLVPFDAAPTADKAGKPAAKSASKKTTRSKEKEAVESSAATNVTPDDDAEAMGKLLF